MDRCKHDALSIMDAQHAEYTDATMATLPSDFWAIVYVSKAARPVTRDDLRPLLEGARRRNLEESITGVLLYSDGYFLQYMEGPKAGLHRVYAIIKTHPLHYGLIDLVREPIETREFAEWSMACHVVGSGGEPPLSDDYDLLAIRLSAVVPARTQASLLLSHFWAAGRESVTPALVSYSNALARRRLAARTDTGEAD